MGFLRKTLNVIFIIFIIGLLVSCNTTTYTASCIKEEVEIVYEYTDNKVLSYKITKNGEIVEREIYADYNAFLACIDTAEKFGAVCTISTNE